MTTIYPPFPATSPARPSQLIDRVTQGDCISVMQNLPAGSVDFALTDPPYLINYQSRDGRRIANDSASDPSWLYASMRELYRVLKPNSLAVCLYGWTQVDTFMTAWRKAGFSPVGHIAFQKRYTSKTRFLAYRHESAFLLAKGWPALPATPPADILPFFYSGNHLHPTEKSPQTWLPLIRAFTKPGDTIIDPFAGSASTAVAARQLHRHFIAIELSSDYASIAAKRLVPPGR